VNEKVKSAPKELLRRGLLDGTEKLRSQMRDAAQGGQREETEADRAQDKARAVSQQAVHRLREKVHGKKKVWSGTIEKCPDTPVPPADSTVPDIPSAADIPQDNTSPGRIKTREAVRGSVPLERSSQGSTFQIKTKDTLHPDQANVQGRGKQSAAHKNGTPAEHQLSQPMEQGRQKFVREQQKKAALQKPGRQIEPGRASPAQQQDGGSARPRSTSTPFSAKGQQSGNSVRETVPSGKRRIKSTRSEAKAVGRASRQTVKTAGSSRQTIQAGARSVKTAQQTRWVAKGPPQSRTLALWGKEAQRSGRAFALARKRVSAACADAGRPVAKAAVSALRGAVSGIRALAAPLAAAGGAVIPVVLVLCLVGGILASPLGIFFGGTGSGADSGRGQTITSAVQEINQEYNDRVEAFKAGATYDALSISGSRAAWPEVLAVYAVKTVTDPTNGQEVITMDDGKKELLKQVFWDMNELSSLTSTVQGEEDEEDTTTLHITTTHKTTDEMADLYGFNTEQRQQLAELLSDEYQDLWNTVLYGVGTGSGEIVSVALSQVGNVGGQPYWNWYGFTYRVDWCAIFVSWCANECGYIDAGVIPKFAGCVQGSRWFKERGLWQDKSYIPNPGDVVFFDWDDPGGFSGPQDGVPDHVGIVERVENGRVYTVEGNSGDKCCQQSYLLGYYEIYGYGICTV